MLIKNTKSTRRIAKAAGHVEYFCRKHVAMLFGLAAQAASAILSVFDLSAAWDGHEAPANAAGFLRLALTAEMSISGFSKPMRLFTEHETTFYPTS